MARYILPNKLMAYLVIYTECEGMGLWEYGSMVVWEYEFNPHSHTLTLSHFPKVFSARYCEN